MGINWNNIRPYNDSQNNAFEELVCQLAREEEIKDKKSFIRVGTPDGGVESYVVLENGDEYGWQAKFFQTLGSSQWTQIKNSFETAFETHPRLVKYYVCLPIDRADSRTHRRRSLMDRWNEKVEEWTKHSEKKGRKIVFVYWGASELIEKLSQEKHAGRRYFWFNQEDLTDQWFSEKLKSSINDLGKRYTPELNFELEIARIFDGLTRGVNFENQFFGFYNDLITKAKKLLTSIEDNRLNSIKNEFTFHLNKLNQVCSEFDFKEVNRIDFNKPIDICYSLLKLSGEFENLISDLEGTQDKNYKFEYKRHKNDVFYKSLSRLKNYLKSRQVSLSNVPILILSGEAGSGKSHLLADVATKLSENSQPSIFLLGQHFVTDENPWTQILRKILRLNCNEYEFIGALNAKGQSIGSRLIIFIDAINEGKGKYFWPDNIKSFVKLFEKYPWVGLVLSVRTSYEKFIVPVDVFTNEDAVRITHYGFLGVEYEASKLFFQNYKIEQPSIPLLHPEFQNPLFLKLFCEGLHQSGLTRIPEGYEGISAIISFFLKSINKALSSPNRLDYPENIELVGRATRLIAERIVEFNKNYVAYEDAFILLEEELQKYSNKRRFLDELVSEGIFTKNLFWHDREIYEEGIYFSYDRFYDHIIVHFLLEKHLNVNNPEHSFVIGQPLFKYVQDERNCYMNRGIVEALSVQLPEIIGKELYELAPHCKSFYPVVSSFVKSLIWRKSETTSKKLTSYVKDEVIRNVDTNKEFLDTLLLITSNPNHYFNANFLHANLIQHSLPDRDYKWTILINELYEWGEKFNSVNRLIDWAWSDENKSHISSESIFLIAKTISWFLSSPNRYLRDSATKGLISLLKNRIPVLVDVLKEFQGINDPYIYERLYAVAYGCTLRTKNTENLRHLCKYIYRTIFKDKYVYTHVLLRDYAREVIEYCVHKGLATKIDLKKIRPPYKSEWPSEIPTDEDITTYLYDYKSDDFKDYYWSQNDIVWSMQTEYSRLRYGSYGDFGRYVFQAAFSNWSDLDPRDLSNIAVKRVFELGYDVEKHGRYDLQMLRYGTSGREADKPERIGKKYQWIAFYELLAKASDNFKMSDPLSRRDRNTVRYKGPWEPYVRDIDPTILIKKTGTELNQFNYNHWWSKNSYSDWDVPHAEWLRNDTDLPDPTNMILMKDQSADEWFVLEAYPSWSEEVGIGKDKWDTPYKSLWYQIRSYLVENNKKNRIYNWAKKQNFWGRWMPESRDLYQMFSREFYWSPAYNFFNTPYYKGEVWEKLYDRKTNKSIGRASVTAEMFLWEEEYDLSKEESISILRPSQIIYDGLELDYSMLEGEFLNREGKLICFDSSVNHEGSHCLLIRKTEFNRFLMKNNFSIFWTVIGEKMITGLFPRTSNCEYGGAMEISGVYFYNQNVGIEEKLNIRHI